MIFVTGNKFKQQEIRNVLKNVEFADIDLKEVYSMNPFEIVIYKLLEAKKILNRDKIMVEDVTMNVNNIFCPDIKWKIDELKQNDKVTMIHTLGYLEGDFVYLFKREISGVVDLLAPKKYEFGFDNIFIVDGYQYGEAKKFDKYNIRKQNLEDYIRFNYDKKINANTIGEWT